MTDPAHPGPAAAPRSGPAAGLHSGPAAERSRATVVVVGSVNMDLVVTTPTLPGPGETVLGHDFRTVPGGKGANQAAAAARAGARCRFVGAVGDDLHAAELARSLTGSGVDTARLRRVSGPSGIAAISVDDAGENCIVVVPGANAAVTDLDDRDRQAVADADVLLCQLEVPLSGVLAAARAARAGGTWTVLNAAPARTLPEELLDLVDLLVVNEVEAAVLTGGTAEPQALLASVPRVVTTYGARGARYADRDGVVIEVRPPQVTAVDSTGAGDAFAGALAVAWAERRPTTDTLRWACAAGASCAQRPGASTSLPSRADVDELYRTTYGVPA